MTIGISTAVDTGRDNWERLGDLVRFGFRSFELYNKITRIRTTDIAPLLSLQKIYNVAYAFHSMVQDLFCRDRVIAAAEYACLLGEIRMAALLHCSRLTLHITKKTPLTTAERTRLRRAVHCARLQRVVLCLENNSSSSPCSGVYLFKLVTDVPGLRLCLDIGHLHIAHHKRIVPDLDEFIRRAKPFVQQLHINFNNGRQDQHADFNRSGAQYLRRVVAPFMAKRLPLIIETKTYAQAKNVRQTIRHVFRV